jgi:hypothetical protein
MLWLSVANLTFHNVSFNFATPILKFDTFSLYHIVHTQIAKVTASFSLFALSELVCTKKLPYPIHYSLLIYPKLIHFWSIINRLTDGRTRFFTPCSLILFFPLSTRGPTRRRKFNGLAELRGGWPIETTVKTGG